MQDDVHPAKRLLHFVLVRHRNNALSTVPVVAGIRIRPLAIPACTACPDNLH